MEDFHKKLRYDPHLAMEDMGAKKIYIGDILAVAKSTRGLRLGAVLLLQTLHLAEKLQCECYYSGLTGNYSLKIFKDQVRILKMNLMSFTFTCAILQ